MAYLHPGMSRETTRRERTGGEKKRHIKRDI
jgi:hypothetical protein